MNNRLPVVFVGHGSPMNAIQDNEFTKALAAFGGAHPKPKEILCVSAHWVTDGTFITGAEEPEQIYDFYGFPPELYAVSYRPRGARALAKETEKLLGGLTAGVDTERGIDHGTWSVLKHMYPAGDIPVFQVSLDAAKSAGEHHAMAHKLMPLRDEGVLIVASGNVVHNLSLIDWAQFAKKTPSWALEFDRFVADALETGDDTALIAYTEKNRHAAVAVPTDEHYLPLLYACALRAPGEKIRYIYEGFQHGSISMRSFVIGGTV